jgi:hypothetical protein
LVQLELDALHTQNLEICHPKGTSHTNFNKTIDAQFGSLAVRRNKNKNEKKKQLVSTCASDFLGKRVLKREKFSFQFQ